MTDIRCSIHPKQQIIQACTDLSCQTYPFLCKQCLQDQFQLSMHSSHGKALKSYDEFLESLSKTLHLQQGFICNQYKDILLKQKNMSILRSINESQQHLQNLENNIESQKFQIQSDIKDLQENFNFILETIGEQMFTRLDQFYQSYKQNLLYLKEIAEPLNLILTKFKYYSNINNLKLKLESEHQKDKQTKVMKIKNCLFISKQLEQLNSKKQQQQQILKSFEEVDKALDSLPYYNTENVRKQFDSFISNVQQCFEKNISVSSIKLFGPFLNKQNEDSLIEEVQEAVSNRPNVTAQLPSLEQISKYPIQPNDPRIVEQNMIQNIVQKPNNFKLKIKKKISLELYVNCILSITPQLIVLGLRDGSLRLFDASTNKIIFYPHSYIIHTKEIVYLSPLVSKTSRQKRIASSSKDNEIIIWTLGENNVLYPERKLEKFSNEIIKIMDLEDGAHIVISDDQGELKILNYHDNQIRYRDAEVGQLCDIIYLMKMERFVCISQSGQIGIYNLYFNNTMNQYKYLAKCEKEIQLKGLNDSIETCLISDNMIFYGTMDGKLKIYHLSKNEIIYESQLYEKSIIELGLLRYNGHLVILCLGCNDKRIKAVIKASNENKFILVEQFGEMNSFMSHHKLAFQITAKPTIFTLQESKQQIELFEIN